MILKNSKHNLSHKILKDYQGIMHFHLYKKNINRIINKIKKQYSSNVLKINKEIEKARKNIDYRYIKK